MAKLVQFLPKSASSKDAVHMMLELTASVVTVVPSYVTANPRLLATCAPELQFQGKKIHHEMIIAPINSCCCPFQL